MEPAVAVETSFRGSLRELPFTHLLIDLLDARRSGTLLLCAPGGTVSARVRFEDGVPTAARVGGGPAGNLLQALIPLCARADDDFVLLEGQDALGEGPVVVGQVDPVVVIAAAMRGPVREDAVDRVLSSLEQRLLRIAPGASFERYGFSAEALALIEGLRHRPMTLAELRARSPLPQRVTRRLIYLLYITRALVGAPITRQVSGTVVHAPPLPAAGAPPAGAPRAAPPTVQFSAPSSPTLLETSSASSGVRPRVASRRKHPLQGSISGSGGRYHMRTPAHGSTEVVASTDAVTPSQPPRASASLPELGALDLAQGVGGGSAAEPYRRKAELLLKRNDYGGALQAAECAFDLEPSAGHQAFYAWLLYLRHSTSGRVHPEAWTHLKLALKRDPTCDRAYFYKGMLLKKLGRMEEAQIHFKRALKLNPNNLEAAREVRLGETRRKRNGGLFHRFLDRDPSGKQNAS